MEKVNIGTVYSKRFYYVYIQALSHDQQVIFWTTWRFSEVTIKSSYSVVTFSVFAVYDVIVFMELPDSYIFKGTLEIYHSEWKSVTLNEYVLKFDPLGLRYKTTWRRNGRLELMDEIFVVQIVGLVLTS